MLRISQDKQEPQMSRQGSLYSSHRALQAIGEGREGVGGRIGIGRPLSLSGAALKSQGTWEPPQLALHEHF